MRLLDLDGSRTRLADAVREVAFELEKNPGFDDDYMVAICAGGLICQLVGDPDDDTLLNSLTDPTEICTADDILTWTNCPESLEFALYTDLRVAWRGFYGNEEPKARTIVETIAAAFVEAARGWGG